MRYFLLILTLATAVAVVDAQGRRGHQRPGGYDTFLTEDQRAQVQALADSLRTAGASRTEIREAIADIFADWGIERPDRRDGFFIQLNEDQRTELRALIEELRTAGAAREEIRAAVQALFETWGLELPVPRGTWYHRRIGSAYNRPNPFNPSTDITYSVEEASVISVQIFDLTGRLVQSYEPGFQVIGTYSVTWEGQLANGLPVPSGIYFYRISAGDQSLVQRMLLLK